MRTIANHECDMHDSCMNSSTHRHSSQLYDPPIQDTNHFLWIETLVCDFIKWSLSREAKLDPQIAQTIARLLAGVWKQQFSHPDSLSAGAAGLQLLCAMPISYADLLRLNERIDQELRIFFLSRPNDPLHMRVSQTEFISQRRFLIDQMLRLLSTQANAFTAPAMPPERPANDVRPLPN